MERKEFIMFNNIGSKIKGLAYVICVLGIVLSVIYGIAMMVNEAYLAGILTIVLGALLSWLGSFGTYGLGQLIENSDMLVAALSNKGISSADGASMLHRAEVATEESKPTWQCACGAKNPTTVNYCLSCRRSRTEAVTTIKCPFCGANNKNTNDKCFVCGKELH